MPTQSHVEDPSKAALFLPTSLDTEQDIFAAAAPLSPACIGKQKTEETAAQGIRPGTLLRDSPANTNLKSNSSDYIDKIHHNNIHYKQNKTQNIKTYKQKSDEWHEGSKQEANIKNQFKLLNKINNSEFKQYEKIRMYNKNNEKNITYTEEDTIDYRINENLNPNIKIWNKTLLKYQNLAENNNNKIRETLLYDLIQNEQIIIEREFGETCWNEIMLEEKTFYNTCNEILEIIEENKKYTWKKLITYGPK